VVPVVLVAAAVLVALDLMLVQVVPEHLLLNGQHKYQIKQECNKNGNLCNFR